MVINGDVSPLFIASNRVIEISTRGTDSQAGYVDHFITAVSCFNIRTFTAQPLMYTGYAGRHILYMYMVLNGEVSHPVTDINREREISACGSDTQAG